MVYEEHRSDSKDNSEGFAEYIAQVSLPIIPTSKAHLKSWKNFMLGSYREQTWRKVDTVL